MRHTGRTADLSFRCFGPQHELVLSGRLFPQASPQQHPRRPSPRIRHVNISTSSLASWVVQWIILLFSLKATNYERLVEAAIRSAKVLDHTKSPCDETFVPDVRVKPFSHASTRFSWPFLIELFYRLKRFWFLCKWITSKTRPLGFK